MPLAAQLAAALGAACVLPSHALRTLNAQGEASRELRLYSFKEFVAEFGRAYEEGTEEWSKRRDIFEKTHKEIMDFNAVPDRAWEQGVTQFMDYTEAERKRLLGYTGRGSRKGSQEAPEAASLRGGTHIPTEFSTERTGAKLLNLVRDQGNCGSCWAEAATSTLEGQVEANATVMAQLAALSKSSPEVPELPTLSSQTVVSCTPNQRHCGGSGGCSGATVELAYEMVKANGGLPFALDWPYESGNRGSVPYCRDDLFPSARVAIGGYTVLPLNKVSPLKEALVQTGGPVAVSVDATHWFYYSGGIFTDTYFGKGDFTVNHAVTLMAYKEPGATPGYWLIKNSWGKGWGELGRIRLEMKEDEEAHCGWDYSTHEGLACDGDPDKAWVCGTCGVLYDSAFPTGIHVKAA